MRMRYAALAATFLLLAALAATLLLTSNAGPQPTSAVQQTAPHSPRDAPATPVTPPPPGPLHDTDRPHLHPRRL